MSQATLCDLYEHHIIKGPDIFWEGLCGDFNQGLTGHTAS